MHRDIESLITINLLHCYQLLTLKNDCYKQSFQRITNAWQTENTFSKPRPQITSSIYKLISIHLLSVFRWQFDSCVCKHGFFTLLISIKIKRPSSEFFLKKRGNRKEVFQWDLGTTASFPYAFSFMLSNYFVNNPGFLLKICLRYQHIPVIGEKEAPGENSSRAAQCLPVWQFLEVGSFSG